MKYVKFNCVNASLEGSFKHYLQMKLMVEDCSFKCGGNLSYLLYQLELLLAILMSNSTLPADTHTAGYKFMHDLAKSPNAALSYLCFSVSEKFLSLFRRFSLRSPLWQFRWAPATLFKKKQPKK